MKNDENRRRGGGKYRYMVTKDGLVLDLGYSDANYFHETEERTITWKLTEGRRRTSHNDPG